MPSGARMYVHLIKRNPIIPDPVSHNFGRSTSHDLAPKIGLGRNIIAPCATDAAASFHFR